MTVTGGAKYLGLPPAAAMACSWSHGHNRYLAEKTMLTAQRCVRSLQVLWDNEMNKQGKKGVLCKKRNLETLTEKPVCFCSRTLPGH